MRMRSAVTGLVACTDVTSACAVIVSLDEHRCRELPVLAEKHATRPRQVRGHQRVQKAGGETALHDESAELRARRERLVAERVVVAGGSPSISERGRQSP